jgi:hypothetical protein
MHTTEPMARDPLKSGLFSTIRPAAAAAIEHSRRSGTMARQKRRIEALFPENARFAIQTKMSDDSFKATRM